MTPLFLSPKQSAQPEIYSDSSGVSFYDASKYACGPGDGNIEGSYLIMCSSGGLMFGFINNKPSSRYSCCNISCIINILEILHGRTLSDWFRCSGGINSITILFVEITHINHSIARIKLKSSPHEQKRINTRHDCHFQVIDTTWVSCHQDVCTRQTDDRFLSYFE